MPASPVSEPSVRQGRRVVRSLPARYLASVHARAALMATAALLTACSVLACTGTSAIRPAASGIPAVAAQDDTHAEAPSNAVAQIALVDERSCARLVSGGVKCWGLLHDERVQLTPTLVGSIDDVVDFAIGDDHSCLLRSDGTVRCWGQNDEGQLGDGTHNDALFPTAAPNAAGVAQVVVGARFSCLRATSGAVSCFGRNTHGELADGTTEPRPLPTLAPSLAGVVSLAAASDHGLAIDADGALLSWGRLGIAALEPTTLGIGMGLATGPVAIPPPTALDASPRVVQIATSATHACARLDDGTVRCWGENDFGQLGDGTEIARAVPVVVHGLSHVVQIAVGRATSCALLADHTARCWGNNNYGQLGDGTFLARSIPTLVAATRDVVQIAIAYGHACAIVRDGVEDGGLVCWGSNLSGELGDRTRTNRKIGGRVLW
jgi:alpha-tubulin suppressor-like RCC1 family protein